MYNRLSQVAAVKGNVNTGVPDLTCLLFHFLPSFECARPRALIVSVGQCSMPCYIGPTWCLHTHTPEKSNVSVRLVPYLQLYALFQFCKFNT